MAHQVIMPKWGLTMKEGKIARWLKAEGEPVQAGEPLLEVETDKITNSVEAPGTGVLFQIVVPAGEVAPVQALIAIIAAPGETPQRAEGGAAPAAASTAAGDAAAANAPAAAAQQEAVDDGKFVRATPAARRVARELGVRLGAVTGTGPDGMVTEKDVRDAEAAGPAVNASPQAIAFAREKGIDLAMLAGMGTGEGGKITKADILRAMNPNFAAQQQKPATPAASAPAAPAAPAAATAARPAGPQPGSVIPMSGIRKIIADNMMASLQGAAQLTCFVEADVTAMVELRETLLARNKKNPDYKLSYNDIIAYAVCRALKKNPIMNSTLQDDGIHVHEHVHLGVAVSLPDGLIVPNIKNADTFGLEDLKAKVRDAATRARKGGLSMDEISGGTFTISNVSMMGVDGFTPILNPPETGILGVGRVVEKPGVVGGSIAIRKCMTLSLTFNHMVTDGGPAMTFLRTLADMLETPALMLA
ncbi:2-oxo acid dehydrogenase subunit E2 [Megalodesulfovibrio paquesii]